MPFILDNENYTIKARRGDSGRIAFEFSIPLDGFHIDFCVAENFKENTKPVISKCYKDIEGYVLEVSITSEDTEKLKLGEGFIGQYLWSLKLHDGNGFGATIIPNKLAKTPKFFVYPKIGECPHE